MQKHHQFRLFVSASALAVTLGSAPAFAQDAAIATARGTALDEVVVTARRIEENVQDVPVAVTAFGGQNLERRQVKNLQDLGKVTPNVFLQKANADPQALTLGIRGQRQNDILLTLDPSVGVYIDGQNLPHTLGLGGAFVDIERVEVLRGPQGTLYGRNTTGGALAVYTVDPTDDFGGYLDVSAGNYSAWNAIGVINVPLAEGLSARFVAQRGQHDGYQKNLLGRDANDEDSQYYRLKIKAQLGERVEAVVWTSYQENKSGGAAYRLTGFNPAGTAVTEVLGEMFLASGGTRANLPAALADPVRRAAAVAALNAAMQPVGGDFNRLSTNAANFSTFRGNNAGLNLDIDLGHDVTLRSISGYGYIKRNTSIDNDGTPFDILTSPLFTNATTLSQEVQLLGGDETLNWVAGGFLSNEEGHDGSLSVSVPVLNPTGNPGNQDGRVLNKSRAVFGQFNWAFAPQWSLTAGYRYSEDDRILVSRNSNPAAGCVVPAPGVSRTIAGDPSTQRCPRKFENTFSGSSWLGSVSYKPADDIMIYAKVARGYRTGSQNLRGNTTQETFAPTQPETTTEYELGWKSLLFGNRLRLNIAAYYDDYKNIQKSVIVPATNGSPITIITNAATARVQGIEIESELKVTPDLNLTVSYGLTDAKYKDFRDLTGDRSAEKFTAPKHTLNVGGRYVVDTGAGDLSFTADYAWVSKTALSPDALTVSQTTQGAYGLLSARIGLDVTSMDVQVSVFARNLLDKEYYVSAVQLERSLGYNIMQLGDPRTFGVQLKKSF